MKETLKEQTMRGVIFTKASHFNFDKSFQAELESGDFLKFSEIETESLFSVLNETWGNMTNCGHQRLSNKVFDFNSGYFQHIRKTIISVLVELKIRENLSENQKRDIVYKGYFLDDIKSYITTPVEYIVTSYDSHSGYENQEGFLDFEEAIAHLRNCYSAYEDQSCGSEPILSHPFKDDISWSLENEDWTNL